MSAVTIDYNDLIDPNCNLSEQIAKAFGNTPGCLGACFVKNVPGLQPLRKEVLLKGSQLGALPANELDEMVHPESTYFFGWSHGKEIMNGKPDFAKGSFYFNPIHEIPPIEDENFQSKYPIYGYPNIWPKSLPDMKDPSKELGQLIIKVGRLIALHCDKYLKESFDDLPEKFLQNMIDDSLIHKARLLHYFPISKEDAEPTPDNQNLDSWCGLHVDHSVLTGLTSAMFVDESSNSYPEVDRSNPEVAAALKDAGLYIKNKGEEFTQVKIPADCLAFQIGEAAQVASRGMLVATPHLVRGAAYPNMVRNTLAVFMQPNVNHELKSGFTFNDFTDEVVARHFDKEH
ncbi:hypothetical protein BC833DRAFT_621721 [Globomyces pollinis-pini]|nr:hypothetical protein BC833DRAFT_621721 [Globomyces pollinis-pini]